MEKVVIIKYGELSTKSDNINFFLKTLKDNIDQKLAGIDHNIKYDYGRMIIRTNDYEKVTAKVKEVVGIHEIIVGYLYKSKEIEDIKRNTVDLIANREFTTFKIETKRSDKSYSIKSPEV
jgi:thiamine biosynthesis protein ThiI